MAYGSRPCAINTPGVLTFQLFVGFLSLLCTPLNLFVQRKEYLPLVALLLCAAGSAQLLNATSVNGIFVSATLLGCAFGTTNAYGTRCALMKRMPNDLYPLCAPACRALIP